MTEGNLFEVLGVTPSAGLDEVESKFVEYVRERIQSIAENFDESSVKAEEDALRALHEQFFKFSMVWAAAEIKKPRDANDNPDAAKIKKKARTMIESMQGQIIEFALCYMQINRFSTLLRDEIRAAEIRSGGTQARDVKWTSDAGVILARQKKQRREMMLDLKRMTVARDVLGKVEENLILMRRAASGLYGADKIESLMLKFISALRVADVKKAQAALKFMADEKKKFTTDAKGQAELAAALDAAGHAIITLVDTNREALASTEEGKFLLRPVESDMAFNSHVRELRKIRAFLAKYHLPYMEYKLDGLNHLKEKLMVVGSLDSLMVLYRRLLAGLVQPLPEMRDVRLYESEVVEKAAYLIETQFSEIPKILERARETVQEFRQNNADVAESAALDQLQEINIDSADGAIASGG